MNFDQVWVDPFANMNMSGSGGETDSKSRPEGGEKNSKIDLSGPPSCFEKSKKLT